ncbi:MAG: O-antigen ligase family protein [Candidatus Berkelbacteria bacterium]|nr:O-antigen ligase family protein [Candidatus Berkelbacteria bacterium]
MKLDFFKKLLLGIFALIVIVFLSLVMNFFEPPVGQAIVVFFGLAVLLLPLFLKKPEVGLALMGFFLPFERIPSVEIAGASVKINHVLALVLLVSFLISKLAQKKLIIPRDPVRTIIILFLFTLTLSMSIAPNITRSVQVFAFLVLMFLIYLTVTLIAQDKKAVIWAVSGILWGAVAASLVGFWQFFGDMAGLPNTITLLKEGYDKTTFGFARVQGLSAEPLYFSNYIFIPLFVSIILVIRGKVGVLFPKFLTVPLVCALLINLVLAIARGAYLAAGVSFILLIITQIKTLLKARIIVPTLAAIFVVLIGSYIALMKSEPRALDEFISHVRVEDREEGESVVSRVNASKQAQEIFEDNVIFGTGLGNFGPIVQGNPYEKPEEGWFIVNNEYLEILAENGIIGFTAFVALLAVVFIRALVAYFKARDALLKALVLGLIFAFIAILAQYATFSTLYIIHFWFLLGLMSAVSTLILNNQERGVKSEKSI